MPHPYTEDQLVEQPAIGLFAELGWTTVSAMEETFGSIGTLLRETKGEVVRVVDWEHPADNDFLLVNLKKSAKPKGEK
ncbi:MAG: hypothetical protein ABSA69_07495 [Verrucomicrobiota bacterium]|jgi:hypothetical protein